MRIAIVPYPWQAEVCYLFKSIIEHLSEIDKEMNTLSLLQKRQRILYANYKNFYVLSFKIPSLSINHSSSLEHYIYSIC